MKHMSLKNIVGALEQAFKTIDFQQIAGQDVVMVLGNVSSGKSTLLMSLIHGPNSLAEREITQNVNLRNGTSKVVKNKCIDINDLFLADNRFHIGHG